MNNWADDMDKAMNENPELFEEPAPKHTFLQRLMMHHDWIETHRWGNLFDVVKYICGTCGDETERWENPDRGELSMDPRVKAQQLTDREDRRVRELERLRR